MVTSILTGDNPFILQTEDVQVPDFILERFMSELEEDYKKEKAHELATKHVADQNPKPKTSSDGYKHSTVSKHMTKEEHAKVSHALKTFRDHVESHGKGSVSSLHKHINAKTKMKSKSSFTNSRGRPINTSVGKDLKTHNMHHTHAYTNDGHKGEPKQKDHEAKPSRRTEHAADHVIHWTQKNGKVHIMGVSRHNDHKNNKQHMTKHTSKMISQNRMNENKKP